MVVIHSYPMAVVMCFITMLCWGSWANTQKLTGKNWRFQLFYWDYSVGVVLFSIILAFTMGSMGSEGSPFIANLKQAGTDYLASAVFGGVLFNIANLLLVAAIDVAGMAVAFTIGVGLALVLGIISTYLVAPVGSPLLLIMGVSSIITAMILNSVAYKRVPAADKKTPAKGIIISIVSGVLGGFFFKYVVVSISSETGGLTPYTTLVFFSVGAFISNFLFNTILMFKPIVGERVFFSDYFTKGDFKLHLIGIMGGIVWSIGMSFIVLAGSSAGYVISYGLGQGATTVATLWGVFVWKEFKDASKGTDVLLALMFMLYLIGLIVIIIAK